MRCAAHLTDQIRPDLAESHGPDQTRSDQTTAATKRTATSTARTAEVTRLCSLSPRAGHENEHSTKPPEKAIAHQAHAARLVSSTKPPLVRKAAQSTASIMMNRTAEFHSQGADSFSEAGGVRGRLLAQHATNAACSSEADEASTTPESPSRGVSGTHNINVSEQPAAARGNCQR